jgi:hypothetical protein
MLLALFFLTAVVVSVVRPGPRIITLAWPPDSAITFDAERTALNLDRTGVVALISAGEGGGPLGSLHDPFRLDYDPESGVKLPQFDLLEGQTAAGLSSRHGLSQTLDDLAHHLDQSPQIERLDQFRQQAYSLLTSPAARQVFDLQQEPDALRTRYGKFRFGQCCLMARRLVEAGVRFVQVNWSSQVEPVEDTGDGGWDMHDRNFQQLQDRHAWMLDQSLSALLDDLDQRGLLETTLVVAMGDSFMSGESNPDRPVTFGTRGLDYRNQFMSRMPAQDPQSDPHGDAEPDRNHRYGPPRPA